jgi:hypothetical protein
MIQTITKKAMQTYSKQTFCTQKDVTFLEQVTMYFDRAASYTSIPKDKLKYTISILS